MERCELYRHYFTAPSFSSLFNVDSKQNIMQGADPREDIMPQHRTRRPSLTPSLNRRLGLSKQQKHAAPMLLLRAWAKQLLRIRRGLTLVLTPLLLSPLLLGDSAARCAFCVLLMATYWLTEAIPLAVTALLPSVVFPLTGVLPSKEVAGEFFNDTVLLFIGSLMVATAVEKSELQRRLALRILALTGSNPKWIMLGFMFVTAILSMFISNTATAAMMVPIGESIITQLTTHQENGHIAMQSILTGSRHKASSALLFCQFNTAHPHEPSPAELKMAKGLILSICYAANIGGIGTLTGTPPNLVMVGLLSRLLPNSGINYLSWMALAFPLMLLCLVTSWIVLCCVFMASVQTGDPSVSMLMRRRLEELPPLSRAEKSVSICFLLLLALWISREPGVLPGISSLFPAGYYSDSTSAMVIAVLLFALPSGENKDGENGAKLLDWPTMQQKFPWNVVLLLGGGFALAAGVKDSGLSELIGHSLGHLHALPAWSLQLSCILITMIITNICSNTVTASIFIPIAAGMASQAGMHPLLLMMPVTIACSFVFVLPVGTPPNAIVFSAQNRIVTVPDMIRAGLLLSVVQCAVLVLYFSICVKAMLPAGHHSIHTSVIKAVVAAENPVPIVELLNSTLIE